MMKKMGVINSPNCPTELHYDDDHLEIYSAQRNGDHVEVVYMQKSQPTAGVTITTRPVPEKTQAAISEAIRIGKEM